MSMAGQRAWNPYAVLKMMVTVLVVLGHVTIFYGGAGVITPRNGSHLLGEIAWYIYSFHMPLYMLASGLVYGVCLEKPGRYQQVWPTITQKIKRLLVPYFLFGILYVAPVMVLLGFTQQSFGVYCWEGIVLSLNARHLWFLPALFLIFVAAALLHKLPLRGWGWTVVGFGALVWLAWLAPYVKNYFQVAQSCYYGIFFYMGVVLHRHREEVMGFLHRHWLLWLILGAATVALYPWEGFTVKIVRALVAALFFLGLAERLCRTKWLNHPVADLLDRDGFGIYLFHPMILYGVFYWLGPKDIHAWLLAAGATVVAFVLSTLCTEGLRALGLGWMMGENFPTRKKG